jgi:hypothetical protein
MKPTLHKAADRHWQIHTSMLTYINHFFKDLDTYSKKIDDVTLFQNQKWINIDEIGIRKKLFIFRPDNKLLVSNNGNVKKGLWEYIDSTTILIELDNKPVLLRHSFIDDEFLILNQVSTENYVLFIKENENLKSLNTIEQIKKYIENKYYILTDPYPDKEYKIIRSYKCFDFSWGAYITYEIKFRLSDKNIVYYYGKSSRKYFYIEKDSKIYKESLDEIIDILYQKSVLCNVGI